MNNCKKSTRVFLHRGYVYPKNYICHFLHYAKFSYLSALNNLPCEFYYNIFICYFHFLTHNFTTASCKLFIICEVSTFAWNNGAKFPRCFFCIIHIFLFIIQPIFWFLPNNFVAIFTFWCITLPICKPFLTNFTKCQLLCIKNNRWQLTRCFLHYANFSYLKTSALESIFWILPNDFFAIFSSWRITPPICKPLFPNLHTYLHLCKISPNK